MKGLEISRGYFEEFGKEMIENDFSDIFRYIAVGKVGAGSENYGFDDEISRDHDFEPGFCIFLPGEDIVDRKKEFLLSRAYAKLPREYMGVLRTASIPVGGARQGVIRTSDFYARAVGAPDGELSVTAWLQIPDYALAEVVNGEVWIDNFGEFSKIRKKLMKMPYDILIKRICGNLLLMGQSGQYNYLRCLRHGEPEAAQLSCNEFVVSSMKVAFLLSHKYMPYYKWSFRALRDLKDGVFLSEKLSFLLKGDNAAPSVSAEKSCVIEEIAEYFISHLKKEYSVGENCSDLEQSAYALNDLIKDGNIRNMNILSGV